jgi:hypothetical protein
MKSYFQNYGITKNVIQRNNQISRHEMEWIGDYDGKNANVHLHVNDNGDMKEIQMKLDNNDLMDLLTIPANKSPLEKRLIQDFFHMHNTTKKRKTKRSHIKRKIRKSRRTLK